ncbi:MAG: sugar phosphate isomerase/epimerase [Clostridia bacterium]|nr:sugar phosphate isomerase/epimerase [Clostridia bacterium]
MKKYEIGVMFGCFRQEFDEGLETARNIGATKLQVGWGWKDLPAEEQKEILRRIQSHGLGVSAVCASLDGIHSGDMSVIEDAKKSIDLALNLGTNVVTSHIGVIPEEHNEEWEKMASVARPIGEYAASVGARLAIETGPESPEVLADFIDSVCPEGLAANLDPANLAMVGGFDPVKAVYTLGHRIAHTHAKDGIRLSGYTAAQLYGGLVNPGGYTYLEVPLGKGDVDFTKWIAALKDVGFDGVLCIEREVGDNPVNDIKLAVDLLNNVMENL